MSLNSEINNAIIDKIKVLNGLITSSVPDDNQAQYGEYTKYIPAFPLSEREIIRKKIMELVKAL